MTLLWIAATLSVTKNRPYFPAIIPGDIVKPADDDDWLILHVTGHAWI